MLRHAEMDGYYQATMTFKLMVLPLTKQLTSIAGNLWARTLCGGRAERNEFLLLHEFHGQGYIVPDKPATTLRQQMMEEQEDAEDGGGGGGGDHKKGGRRRPAYAGGLVLEPKKGFYDRIVLLLDFNSLYPSIIQEFNICFTTVARDPNSVHQSVWRV
jgi:DNA polymerase alpha subunit A